MKGIIFSNISDKPIYQQLFEQLSFQILKGELGSDFNLPSIRTTARELRISIITVKKAWEELERSGLIYTVAGKGCFISDLTLGELQNKRKEVLKNQMDRDIPFYQNLGITEEEFCKMIKQYF
ncbi:MAG: GntR family transcriptional regulator [Spirochaetaceae bacterium]|jgi:GntR family transcriptional regulator|nr:GntR family transcriptional regulator [Spirochaetaceae bacterium]